MKTPTLIVIAALAVFGLVGCKTDVGTATTEKAMPDAPTKQSGKTGGKATMGGGLDEGPVGAPAGVKTGMPAGGSKAGG